MKKFLTWLFVIIIFVCGIGAYVFLANGKMMWHVVNADKTELANDITKSIAKVHGYGNFNFSYSFESEQKDKDGKTILKTSTNSELKIKFAGEFTYLSAKTTKNVNDEKTTTNFFVERTSENITTLYADNGTTKTKRIVSWNEAIAKALGVVDISNSMITKIVSESEYEFPADEMEFLKKSTIAFSFSPFYVGSKILLDYDSPSCEVEYCIDLKGNLRKYTKIEQTSIGGLDSTTTQSLVVNKPGKEVNIDKLTDEQRSDYFSL